MNYPWETFGGVIPIISLTPVGTINLKTDFSFFFCKTGITVGGLALYLVVLRIIILIATIHWEFTEGLPLVT